MLAIIYKSNKHINRKKYTKIDKLRNYKRWSIKQYELKGYSKEMENNIGVHNLFDIEGFKLHKNPNFLGYIDNTKKY